MNTLPASEVIERAARRALKPRIFEPVWKWAERSVRLSVRTTNTPGKYDSSWITYTRGWQEAFSNPRVKEISICAAAQTGKTESILNCIRYAIAEDPGPMLWIMPAESLARSFSETRLQPSLKDCPPCAEQIVDDPDAFKLLEMHFKDSTLNLVGANSPAQLSSRPVRYLFADEIDKFPDAHAKEAGALELAKVRTTSFWNAKHIFTSTPTVAGGQIWQAYLHGTRHKYFVRCPKCQHEQELLWAQVKWPKDQRTKTGEAWNVDAVEKLALYECPACRHPIEQNWRHTMIRGGCWKPTNPDAPADRVSFHLNALYSPWRTWGSIAREFLEVKDSPSGLQNFTNSVLAEPWKIQLGEQIQESGLLELRGDYALGTCPVRPWFITIAADVQRDCIYYTVRAWGEGAESWLVDYGKLPKLESLNEVLAREYNIAGTQGETMKPFKGMIDSGFNAQCTTRNKWPTGGDAVDFLHRASGLSKSEACKKFIALAGGHIKPTPRAARPCPKPADTKPKPTFPDFSKGTWADFDALARLRGIGREGLEFASERGLLWFATLKDCPAWIITDSERVNAQARRMDAELWGHIEAKAWTAKGSWAAWPIGIREAQDFPAIALCEGGPDFLAAHYLALWEQASHHTKRDVQCVPVAMLGASQRIHEDALPQPTRPSPSVQLVAS